MNWPVVNGAGGAATVIAEETSVVAAEVATISTPATEASASGSVVPSTPDVAVFNTSVPIEARKVPKCKVESVFAGADAKVNRSKGATRRGGWSGGQARPLDHCNIRGRHHAGFGAQGDDPDDFGVDRVEVLSFSQSNKTVINAAWVCDAVDG